ncbi:hypothetical protein B0T24DRAFT_534623 [Lasiosphaeria ovina]|uniref:Response regulatory domain-containing protein n=1 Tax=Lasiosphaeria ovina TaxID=92902 RepID=A0AAE0JZ98_9PEZI|nr:hypothetical protein B0T24DRAFT_534623 [Lasiosphaeria ovina]
MLETNHLHLPVASVSAEARNGDTCDAIDGNDQRVPTAKLASIHEHAHSDDPAGDDGLPQPFTASLNPPAPAVIAAPSVSAAGTENATGPAAATANSTTRVTTTTTTSSSSHQDPHLNTEPDLDLDPNLDVDDNCGHGHGHHHSTLRRIALSDPQSLDPASPGLPRLADRFPPSPTTTTSRSRSVRASSASPARPEGDHRRQSLLPSRQSTLIRTLLSAAHVDDLDLDPDSLEALLPLGANMGTRKIWVKRPGSSATLVTINEDDLVDDVRDMILRKYANSLGRQFDSPDLTLRIAPREQQRQERLLGPEEPMARTLDAYFPGGQTVDEALIIDVPSRRTPRASPRTGPPHAQHITSAFYDDIRPAEGGTDYFGPGALVQPPASAPIQPNGGASHPHTIAVLNTGQVPQIPSPGGTRTRQYRDRPDRPRLGRQHTSSPTVVAGVNSAAHSSTATLIAPNQGALLVHTLSGPRTHSNTSLDQPSGGQMAPPAPPLSTPPVADPTAVDSVPSQVPRTATPPPRVASPRPLAAVRPKKKKTADQATPSLMLNGGVPPINVLIVEDNIINLRLLEAFVKRLKVRWQTAMNGREAVTKWRAGGFHLVLMDIQLPVMSGLEATREIRRLERMNSIGAFSVSTSAKAADANGEATEEDLLPNRDMFKSPVIIVALTASSLQSDRHEALAAGCNDFLTKPVTYVWLERKVMEWGCMQALIDFDGWRKWKSFSQKSDAAAADDATTSKKAKAKKNRLSITSSSDAI